jgi:hypothetical protein
VVDPRPIGKPRTVNLTKPEDLFPYIVIDDQLEFAKDGHPTFDSIDEACLKIRDDLGEQLQLTPKAEV